MSGSCCIIDKNIAAFIIAQTKETQIKYISVPDIYENRQRKKFFFCPANKVSE